MFSYCNVVFVAISYLFEIFIVIYRKIIGINLLQWFLQIKLLQKKKKKKFDFFNLSYCKKISKFNLVLKPLLQLKIINYCN